MELVKFFFCRTPKRQNYIEHRSDDGIHWNAKAHRWLTNIILTHIAIEWGLGLPTFIHGKNEKKTFQVQMVDTNGDDRSVDTNISKDQVVRSDSMNYLYIFVLRGISIF